MCEHFNDNCNGMRFTAYGKIKNCIYGKGELDLFGAIRKREEVESIIRLSLSRKNDALGGQFGADYTQANPEAIENRSMISIGG